MCHTLETQYKELLLNLQCFNAFFHSFLIIDVRNSAKSSVGAELLSGSVYSLALSSSLNFVVVVIVSIVELILLPFASSKFAL